MIYRCCPKCKEEKELSKFHKDKNRKYGYDYVCKICRKKYQIKNKDKLIKYGKQYRLKNKKRETIRVLNWRKNNLEKSQKYFREYRKQKYKTNSNFKISQNIISRISHVLKGNNKSLSTMFLIGCEIDYLMYHIQRKFTKGMTWDNYGDWHIDHIKPCAKFDLSNPLEQQKCFNYKNLQPLWAIDNIRKSDKYNEN